MSSFESFLTRKGLEPTSEHCTLIQELVLCRVRLMARPIEIEYAPFLPQSAQQLTFRLA